MNTKYKITIVIVGIVVSSAFYTNYSNTMNIADSLKHEKLLTAELKNNITLLNNENSVLTRKLSTQLQTNVMTQLEKKSPEQSLDESFTKQSVDKNTIDKVAIENNNMLPGTNLATTFQKGVKEDNRVVDINAPFNGIDPASEGQQQKYSTFRKEIENYQFNERFDLRGFMSDPRFSELHASLGVKIMDYVDKQLNGVALMQDNPEGAAMLYEIED